MGDGFKYTCRECGHKYAIVLGRCTDFGVTYSRLTHKIRAGEYGDAWKELFETTPMASIAEPNLKLYRCVLCDNWDVNSDLSIYEPIHPDVVNMILENDFEKWFDDYAELVVKLAKYSPIVTREDVEKLESDPHYFDDYFVFMCTGEKRRLVKKWVHEPCELCGQEMRAVKLDGMLTPAEKVELLCPECGRINLPCGFFHCN